MLCLLFDTPQKSEDLYQAGGGDGAERTHYLYQEPWVVQDVYLGEGSAGVG